MDKVFYLSAPTYGQGAYTVFIKKLLASGDFVPDVMIGAVVKKVEHFNISPRALTATSWLLRGPTHGPAFDVPRDQKFNTRREATDALLRAYYRSKKWEQVPPIPGGHENVWRCLSDFCGAFVREIVPQHPSSQRDRHDDHFHQDEVTP